MAELPGVVGYRSGMITASRRGRTGRDARAVGSPAARPRLTVRPAGEILVVGFQRERWTSAMPLTYGSYLRLDELLSLQTPVSEGPEHDEMLFIVIHQVYELWFREILHELDHLQDLLAADDTPRALHTLKRGLTILRVLVAPIDVLESMTPLESPSFRARLEPGSGSQSSQCRALEFALGQRREGAVRHYPEDS